MFNPLLYRKEVQYRYDESSQQQWRLAGVQNQLVDGTKTPRACFETDIKLLTVVLLYQVCCSFYVRKTCENYKRRTAKVLLLQVLVQKQYFTAAAVLVQVTGTAVLVHLESGFASKRGSDFEKKILRTILKNISYE